MGDIAEADEEEYILEEMERQWDAAMEKLAAVRRWAHVAGPIIRRYNISPEDALALFEAAR